MAKETTNTGELHSENPAPFVPGFEAFHVTANKAISKQVVNLLKEAGVRINETVWHQIGLPEYVIEVHQDDLAKAGETFANDLGPNRTATSKDAAAP